MKDKIKKTAAPNLPKGYKKTEIGVIPEDWEVDKVDNISYSFSGGTPNTSRTEYYGGDINFIASSELNQKRIKRTEKKITLRGLENSSAKLINKGTLLIAMYGATAGVSAIAEIAGAINQAVLAIKPKNVNNEFLFNWFLKNKSRIIETYTQGGQPNLSGSIIKRIQIPLPPLPEQTAIATVLSDTDKLIQALEKKITKKQLIKKGAMQQLLSPKEGWERVKLNKVIEINRGGSPRPIQNYVTTSPNGISWIKIGDTSPVNKYITGSKEKIIPEGIQYSRKVNFGDLLLSNSMSFGRPYILKIEGCIHDGWLVLQNYQSSFDREFLYYTLMSQDVINQYLIKASGSGVLNLNKELVSTVELNRPKDIKEQTFIAQILSDMDSEIEALEKKLAKYKQIKQGLMQVLLTGKIRLV